MHVQPDYFPHLTRVLVVYTIASAKRLFSLIKPTILLVLDDFGGKKGVGCRGAGCGVRGAGCGVRGAGCGVRGAGGARAYGKQGVTAAGTNTTLNNTNSYR